MIEVKYLPLKNRNFLVVNKSHSSPHFLCCRSSPSLTSVRSDGTLGPPLVCASGRSRDWNDSVISRNKDEWWYVRPKIFSYLLIGFTWRFLFVFTFFSMTNLFVFCSDLSTIGFETVPWSVFLFEEIQLTLL